MDEIKIVFSNHESESINDSNVRCYPETFVKELRNGAKAGYRKATVTIANNEYKLILEKAGDFHQWLSEPMHQDLVVAAKYY